jgi:beta-alanine degradation protein BauB
MAIWQAEELLERLILKTRLRACLFAKTGLNSQSVWVLGERGLSHKEHAVILEKTDRQIENDRVRVTRHRMVPGAHTGRHRHAHDYVIVPVTDGRMRLVEGGRESTAELAAGVAYFRAAGVEHDVINGGDQDLIFVEIELVSR